MKIRTGLISNSSSSSFIIGLKSDVLNVDPTLPKWMQGISKYFVEQFKTGEIFKTKEEWDKYVLYNWGGAEDTIEELLENDSYIEYFYTKSIEALSKGFSIVYTDVDNDDYTLQQLYGGLPTEISEDEGMVLIHDSEC